MQEEKKPFLDIHLLKRILQLANRYSVYFKLSFVLSIIISLVVPIRPWLIKYTIDNFVSPFQFDMIKWCSLGMIALLIGENILRYVFNYLTAWLGASIIKDLRVKVFQHLLNARLTYFDTTPIGTSVTRTISDVEAVNDTFSEGLITILSDVLNIIVVAITMFWLNWKLAFVSLVGLPFLLWVTRWFQNGVKKSFQEERTQIGRLNAFVQEHLTGMRIIQIFNAEKREMKKFDEINQALKVANIQGVWYYSLFFPAVEISVAVGIGVMVWLASAQILHKEVAPGIIMAFVLYINMLFRPLRFIADKVNTIQRGLVAAERVFKLLDQDYSIPNNGTQAANHIQGSIAFENVFFAYKENETVLKDITFQLDAGKTLAIIGATGSGKTSIINLLGRFYEPQKGEVKIDNVPIQAYELHSLRACMSIVLQDVFLFAGTIYENITLRNPAITKEMVMHASKAIGADDFIQKLPNDYSFQVRERGATLSMGQRQLITFVRALVYNPKILILDEATSSIDSETEAIVQQAILKLIKGRTSVVIAHRLSTIRHADKIMVLDKGELKEFGTHTELYDKQGQYRNLYDLQFGLEKPEKVV